MVIWFLDMIQVIQVQVMVRITVAGRQWQHVFCQTQRWVLATKY